MCRSLELADETCGFIVGLIALIRISLQIGLSNFVIYQPCFAFSTDKLYSFTPGLSVASTIKFQLSPPGDFTWLSLEGNWLGAQ